MDERRDRESRGRGPSTADLAAAVAEPEPERDSEPAAVAGEGPAALLPGNEAQDFRSRWESVQVGFVDSPREAVERADELVAGIMKRLAEVFAAERADLESQWSRGDDVSTEDLRQALRRYRSFFDRLLSV